MNLTLRTLGHLALALPLLFAGGCSIFGTPNKANIGLRKQVQQLEERVASLERQHEADQQLIAAYRRASSSSQPSLAPDRLAQLFTTHGLKFGRLTGGYDADPKKPGDEALKMYVVPIDESGQPLKAAGSFTIELYDLGQPEAPLIGTWKFDVDEAKKNWYGALLDYTYAFTLPWQTVPKHEGLTVKVTFVEALTGLPFENQMKVTVKLPGAPTTHP